MRQVDIRSLFTTRHLYSDRTGTFADFTAAYRNAQQPDTTRMIRQDVQAWGRAKDLLIRHLSPAQRDEFACTESFTLYGGYTTLRYRLRWGTVSNITLYRPDGHGFPLCFVPAGHVEYPWGDVLLTQKLMLECPDTELQALRIALRFNPNDFLVSIFKVSPSHLSKYLEHERARHANRRT
jgi:hypothetical protein